MTMQFLSATSDSQGYHYSILLDTTKPNDADYIFNRDWAPSPKDANGICTWTGGESAYQQMTVGEVKALAQHHLNSMLNPTPAPTSLSTQGTTF